jgi:hypothetical protein
MVPDALTCSGAPDYCLEENLVALASPAPPAAMAISRGSNRELQLPYQRSIDALAPAGAADGSKSTGDILATYSTADLSDSATGAIGAGSNPWKSTYEAGTIGWTAHVHTTVTGGLGAADPVLADTAATSSDAAAQADSILVSGYKIWVGNFRSRHDAQRYWMQQVRRFPGVLKKLKATLLPIHAGSTAAAAYRLLGGSLASRAMAESVCGTIQSRSPHNTCRVVLN